jgi:hypothetical protein
MSLDPKVVLEKVKVLEDLLSAAPTLLADLEAGKTAYDNKDPEAMAAALSSLLNHLEPVLHDLKSPPAPPAEA